MTAKSQYKRRPGHRRWWHGVLLWFLALVAVLPFAQMVWTARKPRDHVDASYYYLSQRLPEHEVRRKIEIGPRPLRVALANSLAVSIACSASCVLLASLAGYAFAKKRFVGKTVLFDLVLASMAVPSAILMMPFFRLAITLHIYDTIFALILPFAVTGFGVFYMRCAISAVPDSLIDAARIDGLSEVGALFRVVLPMIWQSVATLAVLAFIASWNAFVLPNTLVASPKNYTIAILLGRLIGDFGGLMWNDIMVVVAAALVPTIIIFALFSRWVIRGSTAIGEVRQ